MSGDTLGGLALWLGGAWFALVLVPVLVPRMRCRCDLPVQRPVVNPDHNRPLFLFVEAALMLSATAVVVVGGALVGDGDALSNLVFGGIAGIFGMLPLVAWWRHVRRRVRDALRSVGRRRAPAASRSS